MKTAIIAEKPSVAREIASIVGANHKEDGFLSGNNYMVTWALGHLVQLAMPEDYGFSGFVRENLPIIPETFVLKPRQIKEGKQYKPDGGALRQLKIIKHVFDSCDKIIVATDAGREGELIFRYIYSHLNCKKPFNRLWISSLTDKAIKDGLQNLKNGSEYDNLYFAAKARSEADWLVGLNSSQALSIAAGRGVYSLGRVQTPIAVRLIPKSLPISRISRCSAVRIHRHCLTQSPIFGKTKLPFRCSSRLYLYLRKVVRDFYTFSCWLFPVSCFVDTCCRFVFQYRTKRVFCQPFSRT